MTEHKIHSEEWFEEAFTNPVTREPYAVPADLRAAATRIVRSYGIRGICDPMYIANVIATETGRGDGQSHFYATRQLVNCAECGQSEFFYVPERDYPALCLDCAESRRGWGAVTR